MLKRITLITSMLVVGPAAAVDAQWAQGSPGRIWVKSAFFWQKTDQEFSFTGERRRRVTGGESDARAVFSDVIVGLRNNLDLWVQIPFFDFRFTDSANDLEKKGFGDIRAWFRWQFFGQGRSTPISLRLGAKAPIGDSPIDAQIIPLGEGQWDFEAFLEVGHSFYPFPAYAVLWGGYRARLANEETLKDPGGEYVYLLELGLQPTSGSLIKATFDGFNGRRLISEGLLTANERRIATLQMGAGVRIGPVWPEVGVRIPVSGREFPAGNQVVFGVSSQIR